MDRVPAAYLRRSQEGGITKDDEIAALKALAVREGANGDLVWYDDWGHTADEGKDQQDRLRDLIADMKAGKIHLVIAGKMDRLARSVSVFARFAAATKEHRVRFVTVAEGDMSEDAVDDDPFKWASRQFMVTMAEMELRTIKARVGRSQRVRKERGDEFGQPSYGHLSARGENGRITRVPDPERPASVVVEAYRVARSIMGAAKLLQARGIPTPRPCRPDCEKPHHRAACETGCATQHPHAGKRWGQNTVTRILEKEAPELFPRPARTSGRRTPTNSRFAQLLACHCGTTLTPNGARHQLYCNAGHRLGSAVHGKLVVSEITVEAWMRDEMAHFHLPAAGIETQTQNTARRTAVDARLERYSNLYGEGSINRKRWEHEKARAAADLDALDSTETVVREWPELRDLWGYKPADVAKILREILVRVDLNANMLPTSATWRNPALRRACDDPTCTHCPRP